MNNEHSFIEPTGLLSFDYISIAIGDPITKRRRIEILLTGLTPPHLCACPKPGPRFPISYVVVSFLYLMS